MINENNTYATRYKFLLKEPILYVRHITPTENIITKVKFIIISYNRLCNNYAVFLYETNKEVNWDEILIKKFDFLRLLCDDNFFLENSNLERFLEHFGLK